MVSFPSLAPVGSCRTPFGRVCLVRFVGVSCNCPEGRRFEMTCTFTCAATPRHTTQASAWLWPSATCCITSATCGRRTRSAHELCSCPKIVQLRHHSSLNSILVSRATSSRVVGMEYSVVCIVLGMLDPIDLVRSRVSGHRMPKAHFLCIEPIQCSFHLRPST